MFGVKPSRLKKNGDAVQKSARALARPFG